MKKSIFMLCALAIPAISQSNPVVDSDASEAVYWVDIIVNKGDEFVSYNNAILEPIRHGQTATTTFGGKTTLLKYSGATYVQKTNGKTISHQFLYVTEENRFIANIYIAESCGEMALNENWPLSKAEYQVQNQAGNCLLTVKIAEIQQQSLGLIRGEF